MKMSDFVSILREIKAQYGDIEIVLNDANILEHIKVIKRSEGDVVSLSGDKYKVHKNIALGTGSGYEEFYNYKRLKYEAFNKL